MRISDWSSDVCSSDLRAGGAQPATERSRWNPWVGRRSDRPGDRRAPTAPWPRTSVFRFPGPGPMSAPARLRPEWQWLHACRRRGRPVSGAHSVEHRPSFVGIGPGWLSYPGSNRRRPAGLLPAFFVRAVAGAAETECEADDVARLLDPARLAIAARARLDRKSVV